MTEIKIPRKLIEVALPLDAINVACVREKSMRHGHPSALHLWWARRPLAAARAVIFAQMVNDPGYERNLQRGMNKEKAAAERERLFRIIEKLVQWENTNNEDVLKEARAEILKSWEETCNLNKAHPNAAQLFNPKKLPAFHDPFAGGGAIPLEAQRLGLESYASDLNPVAVTINKAMIEIPSRFSNQRAVGPIPDGARPELLDDWSGARGLAEDVYRYGLWIKNETERRIGFLYPEIEISSQAAGQRPDLVALKGHKLKVIAWLWARTVKSPNPAFSHLHVPLVSTFILSSKKGKEAYVEPVVLGDQYDFTVKIGVPTIAAQNGTKAPGRGANFLCLLSGSPISGDYIKAEGQAGRMGSRLMAIIAEGPRGRVYIPPTKEHEEVINRAHPEWKPDGQIPARLTGGTCVPYGLKNWSDLFTSRQLTVLTTFSNLITETRSKIIKDAVAAGMINDGVSLDKLGKGATAYADAVSVYLSFMISQLANHSSNLCGWNHPNTQMRSVFSRQAIQMVWDYAEANPFSDSSGSFNNLFERQIKGFEALNGYSVGFAVQCDAAKQELSSNKVVSTDPPYYDNISYADLSDFFYTWLRRNMKQVFPDLYATMASPKTEELVATAYRHGGKEKAEEFFLTGMTGAIHNLAEQVHPAFPVTIYYAFKQSETENDKGTSNTGWDTFLQALLQAGFSLAGTWPMRTEKEGRVIGNGTNSLASSIILVCKKRDTNAPTISRREFIRELNALLPEALDEMTRGGVNSPVAPVDLSQAIIGPGMAVFSKYTAVLEADGKPMTVKTAMQLINRFLAEDDFDHDTQFCLHWFENYGWSEGRFGDADVLARAKGTSVAGVQESGVLASGKSVVKLMRFSEYPKDWNPEEDKRIPVWEALHQLIRVLQESGETAAGELLAKMPGRGESIRQLAYRLHTLCERKGWSDDARAYNELITSWNAAEAVSQTVAQKTGKQMEMGI